MADAQHILSYAQTFAGGGVERALLRLCDGWVASGRRVTLLVGSCEGPLAAELRDGVELIVLGSTAYRALFAVPRIVAQLRPDVIFCPGSHYTSVAAWTRMRLRGGCPPIVGKVSNALDRGDHGAIVGAGHRAWLRLHPHFLDRMVAMTPAMADATITATGIARERVAVIPNPPAMRIAGAVGLDLPGLYILGVGRLAPQKRWDRLIAALPRLADTSVALVILGEGAERGALTAQAAASGVADRVLLPGHSADPLGAMERAAVVALTSDYEGVPGVLREALSVGAPVVATDCSPAMREIVSSAALGDVVAREDNDALVAALDRWLGGAARPAPITPPGVDSVARYLALFDSLV
ncbi:glycosyltransferase [Sphingomonas sp. SUN019]|uniref:glycosyltransferase n=1 Tax=Sphingomonas sp. SUN019 TaxID=2937788 RepID=UPI002164A70A|nr:glycosyltransferase [Sphingomonas sp. SUN019]UVO51363.1 glycosyltransferase [Sphingomonas sp. SUN019]